MSPLKLGIAMLLGLSAAAQDVKLNVTYVCSGERMYVESCNIRDLSDAATCQVAHPDRPKHNGFMAYTSETRGSLKALLPTCTQPTAKELAAADAFKKKQQEIYDANVAKANPQAAARQARRQTRAGPRPLKDSHSQPRLKMPRNAPYAAAFLPEELWPPVPATRSWVRLARSSPRFCHPPPRNPLPARIWRACSRAQVAGGSISSMAESW